MAGQRVELPPFSMFSSTPLYEVAGDIVFGLKTPPVLPDTTDEMWPMPSVGVPRLDLLSYTFYGTPELYWVLADVNNWLDPLVGIPVGTKIRVPTRERLASEGILNV